MNTILLLVLAACGGAEESTCPGVEDARCPMAQGAAFTSVDELECGLGPEGEERCHWHVDFAEDGTWSWSGSDYALSGTWSCEDGGVTGVDASGDSLAGSWDDESCLLTWDGVSYRLE